jgi:cyanate lyase
MDRKEATAAILKAKKEKGLTWAEIGKAVGAHEVWVTSGLLGQASMGSEEATKALEVLGLDKEVFELLQECPIKGCLDPAVPVDPLLYRFYEIMQVYGTTMKEIIHEKFGDGIMSAVDFEIDIQKKEDPKGDRVIITFNGKFLPYRKW